MEGMRSSAISLRGLAQSLIFALVLAGLVTMPTFSLKAHANDPLVINNGFCNLPGGSSATNYSIASVWDLWETTDCAGTTKVFTLAGPINIEGFANAPTNSPIGFGSTVRPFSGTLNGNGHAITGIDLELSGAITSVGLFASLNNAMVQNLTVSGILTGLNTSGDLPMGTIAANASGRVTFSQVTVDATLTGRGVIGGFIGQGSFTSGGRLDVIDSINSSSVTGTHAQIGGFAASLTGPVVVSNFKNFGPVRSTGFFNVGGFVGIHLSGAQSALTASQVLNFGTISSTTGLSGGVAGTLEVPATITDSENHGNIRSRVSGGLVGIAEQRIRFFDSANYGSVFTTPTLNEEQGGFIGQSRAEVQFFDSTNSGQISGTYAVGGLVGRAFAASPVTITRTVNSGNVSASGIDSGGFIGRAEGASVTVNASSNSGTITGTSNTGGFVGIASGSPVTIEDSANSGPLTGTTNVGGFVGLASRPSSILSISRSVNQAAVSGVTQVGGLAGNAAGNTSISNTLNKGSVTATTGYAGGLVGVSNAIVELLRSWNSAPVSGANYVGGLVGFFFNDPGRYLIAVDSVNTGAVTATNNGGGFVGLSNKPHQIVRSYQAGILSSGTPSDALFLGVPSTITSVYTNQSPSQWIPVSTDAELRLASTYVGWDFDTVWGFIDCTTNNGFPVLRFAYPGETFRTDGCEAVAGTTATQSATTSSDVATTSSEIVETERGPILFKGPLILAFDKRDIASDTPTQIRVIGVRLNFITGLMVDGKEVEFTKIGTKGMVIELPALSSGVHHLMIETTRYGKLTLFRAFAVK